MCNSERQRVASRWDTARSSNSVGENDGQPELAGYIPPRQQAQSGLNDLIEPDESNTFGFNIATQGAGLCHGNFDLTEHRKKTCVSNSIAHAGFSLSNTRQVRLDPLFTGVLGTNDDCVAVAFIPLVVVACTISRSLEATGALR